MKAHEEHNTDQRHAHDGRQARGGGGFVGRLISRVAAVVMRSHYRIAVRGHSNLPSNGPAVLVFNLSSYVDLLLIAAALRRPVRFFMSRRFYYAPLIWPLARLAGAIPVSYEEDSRAMHKATRLAHRALENGEVVGLFPEAAVSPHGYLMGFNRCYQDVVGDTGAKLIPAHIDGTWGSIFSFFKGRLFSHAPSLRRRSVIIRLGKPVPPSTPPWKLRQHVEELSADTLAERVRTRNDNLAQAFVRTARRRWFAEALFDTTGKNVTFGKALIGAVVLARMFRARISEEMVGVMMPATTAGNLANLALTIAGKIPVNLNFTASKQVMQSAADQCSLGPIITSKKFMAKLDNPPLPREAIYLEDLAESVSGGQKALAMLLALLAPSRLLVRGKGGDNPATIIFSSGSTAAPKGIIITHNNVFADIESMRRATAIDHHDTLCAVLPFFHSFGYTVTMWLPVTIGLKTVYHPNPLDGEIIAGIVRDHRATILLATPTFLRTYIRKAAREDFASLRLAVVGAEKMRKDLATQFEERFGIRPLEGYGTTELSPVAALNVPDAQRGRRTFVGNKLGTIGRTLPGIVARIVDQDTGEELGPNRPGMMLVKGGNVMKGYFHNDEQTREALRGEWYVTNDIAAMDEEGFITITDRLSRFSKIAGEMVPHGGVEEALQDALGTAERVVAVTAAVDTKRGEKLVVLHTPEAGGEEAVWEAIQRSGLPNLWRPTRDALIQVEGIPVLGTGKTDLKRLKAVAAQWMEKRKIHVA